MDEFRTSPYITVHTSRKCPAIFLDLVKGPARWLLLVSHYLCTFIQVERRCVECGHDQMTYTTQQTRSADEGQTVFYTCPVCNYKETENSSIYNWASEASPSLGCSIEISRYIYMCMCLSWSKKCRRNYVGQTRACSKSVLGGKIRPVTPRLFI